MRGKHHIVVQNNRLRYELDIRRNITIIRGDSATGKTTLIGMLTQAMNLGDSSGVEVRCDKELRVLGGREWKLILQSVHDQIVFLDEENEFIKTQEFAGAVRDSDCYFVIMTREDLPNLPYSVDEIYGIHTSGRYHDTRRVYNELYRIYSAEAFAGRIAVRHLVTEDSNAGFQFFRNAAAANGLTCTSAGGKSNLVTALQNADSEETVAVADGAAIGPEMNDLFQLMSKKKHIHCYLPESFEWLILKSGLIKSNQLREILEHPEDYIESRDYFSWERYFNKLLTELTVGTFQQYSKTKLNDYYLQENESARILGAVEGIDFKQTDSFIHIGGGGDERKIQT